MWTVVYTADYLEAVKNYSSAIEFCDIDFKTINFSALLIAVSFVSRTSR